MVETTRFVLNLEIRHLTEIDLCLLHLALSVEEFDHEFDHLLRREARILRLKFVVLEGHKIKRIIQKREQHIELLYYNLNDLLHLFGDALYEQSFEKHE